MPKKAPKRATKSRSSTGKPHKAAELKEPAKQPKNETTLFDKEATDEELDSIVDWLNDEDDEE